MKLTCILRGVRNRVKSWTQVSEIQVEIRDLSILLSVKLRKIPVMSAFYPVNYMQKIEIRLAARAALLLAYSLDPNC